MEIAAARSSPHALEFARVIYAAFTGKLPALLLADRIAVINAALQAGVDSGRLEKMTRLPAEINRVFGRRFLNVIGLATDQTPHVGWPGFLLSGKHYESDPIANALVIVAACGTLENYVVAANGIKASSPITRRTNQKVQSICGLTRHILKRLKGTETLQEIAKDSGIAGDSMRYWSRTYPGLSRLRKESRVRQKHQQYEQEIALAVESNPKASRTRLWLKCRKAIDYLSRKTPHSLEAMLPPSRIPPSEYVHRRLAKKKLEKAAKQRSKAEEEIA
ncbi:MAG: hypothetical protein ABI583_09855 [Betaproteobacteria bacterium]